MNEVVKEVAKQKRLGKKVGLITGCFDILHFGHVQLFRFAKKHCDFLVVGLDSDKTIALSKGKGRPVNSINHRLEVISELRSVDIVFPITANLYYEDTVKAHLIFEQIIGKIRPDCLITNVLADDYWKEKQVRAKKMGIDFKGEKRKKMTSTTEIVFKLD